VRTIHRNIASAVIISSDNKVLLGQKDPKSGRAYADGSWLIPGGGIEPGETALEAALREVLEETGLIISAQQTELIEDKGRDTTRKTLSTGEEIIVQMQFFTFRVVLDHPASHLHVLPSDELPVLGWINLEELADYKLPAPSVLLFTKLGYLS